MVPRGDDSDFFRGLSWGLGLAIGVSIVLFVIATVVFLVVLGDDSGDGDICPPGLEGTGVCDGLPGALQR